MTLQKYIDSHLIVQVGPSDFELECAELIVDNPVEFIRLVNTSQYFISEIIWWDRTKIGLASPIGGGGPCDPRLPTEYYFSETFISHEFEENTPMQEYLDYIHKINLRYLDLQLFPGFSLNKKLNTCP